MFAVDESDVPVPYNINSQRPALVCTCPKQLGNQKEQAKVIFRCLLMLAHLWRLVNVHEPKGDGDLIEQ